MPNAGPGWFSWRAVFGWLSPDVGEDAEDSVGRWRSTATITVLSVLLLVVISVLDWWISPQVAVLTTFLALSPLLAASVLPPGATAEFAVAAVALAAVSGWWNHGQGAQYWIRLVDVALVGALAVLVSM